MDRVKIGNKINNWINEKSKTCKIIKFLNTDEPNKYTFFDFPFKVKYPKEILTWILFFVILPCFAILYKS